MPAERSPGRNPRKTGDSPPLPQGAPAPRDTGNDPDTFWAKMGGLLSGMESRMKKETEEVKERLDQAIGDLGARVERTVKRLDGIAEEFHSIVDSRLASVIDQASLAGEPAPFGLSMGSVVFLSRLTSYLLVPARTCMHSAFLLSIDRTIKQSISSIQHGAVGNF